MKTLLTLSVQVTIDAESDDDYESKRDAIIKRLNADGYDVDVTSEDDDDDDDTE